MRKSEAISMLEKKKDEAESWKASASHDPQRATHSVRAQAFEEALEIVRRIESE